MTKNLNDERKVVDTELSIHPEIKDSLSDFQKECLEDEISTLPPIKDGQVDVSTDYIFDVGDSYEANVFIRNGLRKSLSLEKIPLRIIDSEGKVLASKIFGLRDVGEIPPYSVRPWKIYFSKQKANLDGYDLRELKIVFNTKIKAESVVKVEYENLPEKISLQNKEKYTKFLEKLPLLREGQFSMSAYDVSKKRDGGISVTVVIRNGSRKGIKIKKFPITIIDAKGDIAASGTFYLEDVSINPYKARIYKFDFEKNEINKADADLSKWDINFTMKNTISAGDEVENEK
ncbi:SLAP domain-containing protein [Clostridium sp. ZS2-4]|uniref:SLAP domain-containing protein n=1 Tax=Clostridium sp. ZS2-4 TaxID=2987703 RepID=UPI00227D2E03|nr:SLAP domain-containing protein [Clostridium sp. ZS2-4]MCY6355101.1 SLAP domain-containing protein [Clostridium sp. ZS2-4]